MAGRPKLESEPWYEAVAELMVREDLSFSASCQANGVKFAQASEERNHERRASFQKIYWGYRNKFHQAIGSDPNLTKEMVMGVLARTIVKLEETKDYDKIATATKTLSDIAGWTKSEPTMAVVGTLTQAEIDAVKERLRVLGAKVAEPETKKPN